MSLHTIHALLDSNGLCNILCYASIDRCVLESIGIYDIALRYLYIIDFIDTYVNNSSS